MVEIFGNVREGDIVAQQGSEELQNQSRVQPIGKALGPKGSNPLILTGATATR
jgi:hypothetical protein